MEDLRTFADVALFVIVVLLFLLPWPLFLRARLIKRACNRSKATFDSFLIFVGMITTCSGILYAFARELSEAVAYSIGILFFAIIPILLLLRLSQHKKTPPAGDA